MQSKTDTELLQEYARQGSEAAFGEIVRRYADFVYSAALRQVGDAELARDLAQVVFADLARKAGSLHCDTLLIGWLCRGARLAALEQIRQQQRRLLRERKAMELAEPASTTPDDWSAIRPVLDEAIAQLAEEDRNALLLRFFRNESLAAVGAGLGVSEDAAQKRVSRALGKLRDFLAERGIHTTAAALSLALTANAVQAAPVGFAAAITAGALAQAANASSSFMLMKLLTTQDMKTALLGLVLAGGVAGLTVQQVKTQRQLHAAQANLQQQSDSLQALQGAQEQFAAQNDELRRLRADSQELTRLRGDMTRLKQETAARKSASSMPELNLLNSAATNARIPTIGLAAKFVLLPTETLKQLNLPWSSSADGMTSALVSTDQLQIINQALDGANNVKVLGTPRVVGSSGGRVTLFAGPRGAGGGSGAISTFGGGSGGPVRFSVAGSEAMVFGKSQLSGEGGGVSGAGFGGGPEAMSRLSTLLSGTNSGPGMTLNVVPTFTPDTSIFDLQITAGFSPPAELSSAPGSSEAAAQVAQSTAHITVPASQTLILAKEVPEGSWTEADGTVPGTKTMLVFITPSKANVANRLAAVLKRETTNSP